jgi:hypothetical protein
MEQQLIADGNQSMRGTAGLRPESLASINGTTDLFTRITRFLKSHEREDGILRGGTVAVIIIAANREIWF